MTSRSEAVLKSTGERLILIGSHVAGGTRHLCLLPPQQPWHRPRFQRIRGERLQFAGSS
jgi:hypothetical protein